MRGRKSRARHPSRPSEPFDIVYTAGHYDVLSPARGRTFTESITPFVKPGGVLLTGTHLPALSHASRALALAFTGLEWCFWDEATWKDMLSGLPFDFEASRFEVHPPATLAVLARRKPEQ